MPKSLIVGKKKPTAPKQKHPKGWWHYDGPAPHVRWAGATINIPATYVAKRERWESPDGKFYFDRESAEYGADFFPTFLVHHIGEFSGQQFDLLDYQKYLVWTAWGWKRAADDYRRFRKIFLAVPKGNGKSPFGSGLGILLGFFDNEPGAECYSVAGDKDQARIVFDTAKIMVEKSDELAELLEVRKDSITIKGGTEYFQVLSSDAPTKHGYRPHGIVFDEFHTQPTRDLFETLERGLGKRRQPMLVMITTAGEDEESICFEEWEYARKVISDPLLDEIYLPMIFECGDKEDWTKPELWKRLNPGYGITIKEDYFINACKAAQIEPRKRNSFLKLHLNRWTNTAVAWIPVEWWDACVVEDPRVALSAEALRGFQCCAGLDMAQKIDLASFSMVFKIPLKAVQPIELEVVSAESADTVPKKMKVSLNFAIAVVTKFWIPEETMLRHEKDDRVPYSMWRDMGLVKVTEGSVIDDEVIYSDIIALVKQFPLLKQGEIGYDPAFATSIALRLQSGGHDGKNPKLNIVEVPQNYRHFTEPCQVFEGLVAAKRVLHDGSRLLRWNIENMSIKTDDAGRIRPIKQRKSSKRIDGGVATIMGLSRLIVFKPKSTGVIAAAWI